MDAAATPNTILWLAFAVAFVFGVIGQKTHFCTMGAVSDIVNMGDWRRMRMWLLAIGVAILGAAILHAAGLIDLGKSIYRTPTFTWLSYLIGGGSFGVGMVLASGCGSKTLIRIGSGNLKSVVVFLVLGLVAYMTMRGIFGVFRVNVLEKASLTFPGGQDLPALLTATGVDAKLAFWGAVLAIGVGLTAFCLLQRDFWTLDNLLGGIGTGLAVVAAWYVSGHLGYLAEHPETLEEAFIATNSGRMESLTFVAPLAYAGIADAVVRHQPQDDFRHRHGSWRHRRRRCLGAGDPQLPLGRFREHRRHCQAPARRRADGLWRRHRHGLHGGAGDHGGFDPGARLHRHLPRHRHQRRSDPEVPVLAADARGLSAVALLQPGDDQRKGPGAPWHYLKRTG